MKLGPKMSDHSKEVVDPLLFCSPGSYLPLAIAFKMLFQEEKPAPDALDKSGNNNKPTHK
ncbi:MAG: hypothetical protein JSR17_07935 [Proteobacteria bacterium]|nr:hypothetical protein [Pseudomonadota bacterium]